MRTIEEIEKDIDFVQKDLAECRKMGASTYGATLDLIELMKELREVKEALER